MGAYLRLCPLQPATPLCRKVLMKLGVPEEEAKWEHWDMMDQSFWSPTCSLTHTYTQCSEEDFEDALVAQESDGIDWESPEAIEGETLQENLKTLLPGTCEDTVQDPTILHPFHPVHLQTGLHHVHGGGQGPGNCSSTSSSNEYCG